jgi:hypothetical protein
VKPDRFTVGMLAAYIGWLLAWLGTDRSLLVGLGGTWLLWGVNEMLIAIRHREAA